MARALFTLLSPLGRPRLLDSELTSLELLPDERSALAARSPNTDNCIAAGAQDCQTWVTIQQRRAMLTSPSLLLAAALLASEAPPAAATALLSAVASGDLQAAGATLADDAPIMDSRGENFVTSTLQEFAAYARDCRQAELYWDVDSEDPRRAAVTVRRDCASGAGSEDFIWTDGNRIVHIQFGLPLAPRQ